MEPDDQRNLPIIKPHNDNDYFKQTGNERQRFCDKEIIKKLKRQKRKERDRYTYIHIIYPLIVTFEHIPCLRVIF